MSNQHTKLKSSRSDLRLSDTQLVLLSAAAQRDDRCLTMTPNLKGGAMLKVTKKLIASGLVIEIKAKAGAPVWRRDEENAQSYALQLTASGLRAIVVDEGAAQEGAGELSSSSGANPPTAETVTMPIGYGPGADEALHEDGDTTNGDPSKSFEGAPTTPRTGSKLADVIALLRQHQGATIDELIAATNWLPHTTRAALTGLRKRGYGIERTRLDGRTRYRIAESSPAAGAANDEAATGNAAVSAAAEKAV
jgi:Protein of unknown function (DUF3489)